MKLSAIAAMLLGLALSATLCACLSHVGVEPAEGIIFDRTYGTMYIEPEFMKDFQVSKLDKYRRFQTTKVVIPAPFTFGALSFAWGGISTHQIMEEAGFKKLYCMQYRRLGIATVYTNYEITAYGE